MDSFRTRLQLTGLEDRLTPAVSPADVFAAMKQAREAKAEIAQIAEYFSGPVNVYAQSYYATVLPNLVDTSVRSAVVLDEYFKALETLAAGTEDGAPLARTLVGGAGTHLSWSYDNVTTAETRGVALGAASYASRNTPAVPPPTTNPDEPKNPDIPRDTSGMTNVLPSITAPEWQDVGNGLRVWDVVEGTGDPVQSGQEITLHYTGWLRDGTIFDTSTDGEPVTFDLDNLIQGWQQAIPGMKPGGIRRLDIPSELAYGTRGSPPSIPPDADLVFEIKMFASADSSS